MTQAFLQAFAAFSMFFQMLHSLASAGNHLATAADEAAGEFADEARNKRKTKELQLASNLAKVEQDLADTATTKPTSTKAPK